MSVTLHSIRCKCKLVNFNQCNLMVTRIVCGHVVLYPMSVRRNSVVCPHESLLKLGVPWVKKRFRNTVLNERVTVTRAGTGSLSAGCSPVL
jgi:hypothetical protein